MDESWRIPIKLSPKIPNVPRRNSTEETSWRTSLGEAKTLHPEDFDDVFGGPPRSVLAGQFSAGDFTRSSFFYQDIFLNPALTGRRLPELRIPATGGGGGGRKSEEFYSDIFGKDLEEMRGSRSRSKSKTNSKSMSNSSSVLSSEDFSPFGPPVSDDDAFFSVLASKLRPKHIPSKWNTSTVMHEVRQRQHGIPDFSSSHPSFVEKHFFENEQNEIFKRTNFGFSQRVSSPETISLGPNSYGSAKVSVEDLDLNSPSYVQSSLRQEQEAKVSKTQDKFLQEEDEDEDDDDDEVTSSYVIEINSDHKEGTAEAQGLDEAIAWAKEKFQSHSSLEDWSMKQHEKELSAEVAESPVVLHFPDGQIDGCGSLHLQEDETPNNWKTEEERKMDEYREMALLDEDIRLWASGKERNIQLLLSTLHDILWPSSGWYPVPLTNLNESSNVKKAYQKARLCLHPDKLQQRGANLTQKYIAENAFPILQDAWDAFISQNVIISTRG